MCVFLKDLLLIICIYIYMSARGLGDQRCWVLLELELQVASCVLPRVGAGNPTLVPGRVAKAYNC